MFKTVVKSELSGILRDKMNIFFVFFPVIIGVIGYYVIPIIEESVAPTNPVAKIVAMFMIIMTGYIFGAVTAFTLLDDRDDNVLMSLKITPVSVRFYVVLKMIITYVFGLFATILLIYATRFLPDSTFGSIFLISLVAALQGPFLALMVNSFARNKVEGFVIMKTSGLILLLPVLVFFVFTWKEVFLIFSPSFWPARMIQMEMLPIYNDQLTFTFLVYFFAGIVYNIFASWLLFKLFAKKANI
ncbi:MAG: hypothetical protein JXB08_05615 [Bacilli bacterium]|nr:hypothetical protein [Bacilli bacterium]MBN2877490.1 hypothetical protein [Bacilli bacterium]